MSFRKVISISLNVLLLITMLVFLLEEATPLDLKSQFLKTLVYYGILALPPLTLIWNLIFVRSAWSKIKNSLFPLLALIGVMIIGPMNIVFAASSWQTQSVLFQDKFDSSQKVENQVQDMGALGINRRTVKVKYLTPWLILVEEVPPDTANKKQWLHAGMELIDYEP